MTNLECLQFLDNSFPYGCVGVVLSEVLQYGGWHDGIVGEHAAQVERVVIAVESLVARLDSILRQATSGRHQHPLHL